MPVAYTWSLTDDPGMSRAKQEAADAARKGHLDALFRLSRILARTAKTDADRQRALTVLRGAAAKGHAAAQYALGRRFEAGDGVEKDLDQAMQWYDIAAKQGDVLAVQRLRLGVLTD
jgi:TPR repeat protein